MTLSKEVTDLPWPDYLRVMARKRTACCIGFVPGTEFIRRMYPERLAETRCKMPYLVGVHDSCDACASDLRQG